MTVSPAWSGLISLAWLSPVTYVFRVAFVLPLVPFTWEKSKSSKTIEGLVTEVVSITLLQVMITLPLTVIVPFGSVTEPLTTSVMLLSTGASVAVVCAWTEGLPTVNIASTITIPTESVTKLGPHSRCHVFIFSCVFMCLSFLASLVESGRKYVVRGHKRNALWFRDRSRQRVQERCAGAIDFPPQEHRVVFVHGVVAVLHEHAAKVTELKRDFHFAAGSQAPDVLAPALPGRNLGGASITRERLALLEVDVNRVIPTTTAVPQCPYLSGAEFRRR